MLSLFVFTSWVSDTLAWAPCLHLLWRLAFIHLNITKRTISIVNKGYNNPLKRILFLLLGFARSRVDPCREETSFIKMWHHFRVLENISSYIIVYKARMAKLLFGFRRALMRQWNWGMCLEGNICMVSDARYGAMQHRAVHRAREPQFSQAPASDVSEQELYFCYYKQP